MVERDPNDDKNVIVEIRAGAGGDEAALFRGRPLSDVLPLRGGRVRTAADSAPAGSAGSRRSPSRAGAGAPISSSGMRAAPIGCNACPRPNPGPHSHLRRHRGRAAEPDEVQVEIREEDINRRDRAAGPGGQSVNTTDSAVRTGICQAASWSRCRTRSPAQEPGEGDARAPCRLFERKRAEQRAETPPSARSQVGHRRAHEKIRTYNFPQNRVPTTASS